MTNKTASIKSADNLILQEEAAKLGKPIPEIKPPPESVPEPQSEEGSQPNSEESLVFEDKAAEGEDTQETPEKEIQKEPENAAKDTSESEEVDEYGTKLGKKKLYTEEEVQAMIRKRLRDKHTETPNEVQQAAKDFTPDPDSSDDWETQLSQFIDNHLESKAKIAQQREWERQESERQADFEIRFTEGMTKYKDFQEVVRDKPISTAMMMAARTMKDPAAFLYAACKQHPGEIERIAKINDAYAQSVEMGRLEEKMRKNRVITSAPQPAKQVTSDVVDDFPQPSIEDRIAAHAKSKRK